MTEYWLFEWLTNYGVKSPQDIKRILEGKSEALNSLIDGARAAEPLLQEPPSSEMSIVAGVGLDLTGHMDCMHPDCRRAQVDKLFRKVWFYFDTVVVWDVWTHQIAHHWDELSSNKEWLDNWFLANIGVLLYVKDLGAEKLLDFRTKRPRSFDYWLKALTVEQRTLKSFRDTVSHKMLSEASIDVFELAEGSIECSINHPILDHTSFFPVPDRIQGDFPAIERFAAKEAANQIVGHLMSDIDSARAFGVPLGITHSSEKFLLTARDKPNTASDVAFNLELPFLTGVPVKTLLDVRQDEREYFLKFRNALGVAARERMRTREDANSEQIAQEIRQDLIEHELRQIKTKLSTARNSLLKKAALNIGLGALLTTCGYVAGMGSASLLGFTAPGVLSASPFSDFIDMNAEIRLSDMFFLWQAIEHAHSDLN